MNQTISSYLKAGLSVIPVGPDKRPTIDWAIHQKIKANYIAAEPWTLPIACIGGAVSGGVTCIDFDDAGSAFKAWAELVKDGMPDIGQLLTIQRTPSGGYHVVFRSPILIRNKKLAVVKRGDEKITLIETRGEGGYFLVAPSAGYSLMRGTFENIHTIQADEAEFLIACARSLNQIPEEYAPPKNTLTPITRDGISPGDDYDAKNTPLDVLQAHGWTVIRQVGEKTLLRRPGKTDGISATWNHIPGRFYVFTTSTDFDNEKVYKPYAVRTILDFQGDFVACAKQLAKEGYGTQREAAKPVDYDTTVATQTVSFDSFRDRIHAFYTKPRESGVKLGMNEFDNLIRFDRGYLNIITGIPTHGKSEFLDFVLVKLMKKHLWNFVVFSPENYPLEIHFNKLAEKYHERNMWDADKTTVSEAIDELTKHFDFIDATEEDLNLDSILGSCIAVKSKKRVDALIIDPWNEIEMQRPAAMSESEYSGTCLRKLRKFARKNNLCIFLVAHPTKMQREKTREGNVTQKYHVPTLYDISGSANFYNKADNGIVVYRDFEQNKVVVYVKKVKFKNYGRLGAVDFSYNRDTGCYSEMVSDAMAPGYRPE